MGSLGMPELLVIAGVIILIFGPKQLPRMGRAIGDTIKEFRSAGKELRSLHDADADDDDEVLNEGRRK